jgi:transposase InsO family protein
LVRDNDGAYGHAFTNRVRAMRIRDRPISPRSPWQNPYVERVIGTLRRDCLDHVLIFGERHLRGVLTFYYNETRSRLGLGKDARYDDQSNDLGRLSSHQSGPDCIIATGGYDFREGQPSVE